MLNNKFLRKALRFSAMKHNRLVEMYRRFYQPNNFEWAEYLRQHGGLHAMGENCSVVPNVVFTDPSHVSLGNNVALTGCMIFGHGGGIAMLRRAYGVSLDKVGKVVIHDNVFIGHNAMIMPGVTIGPNAMVGAGSIVTRDVPPNSIVVGAPAKPVSSLDDYVKRLIVETSVLPWAGHPSLTPGNGGPPDAELHAMRMAHFWPEVCHDAN